VNASVLLAISSLSLELNCWAAKRPTYRSHKPCCMHPTHPTNAKIPYSHVCLQSDPQTEPTSLAACIQFTPAMFKHHIAISALRQIMINSYRLSCSTGCLFNGLLQLEAPAILMLQLVDRIRDSIQPSSARKDPEARASEFSSQALSPEGAPLYS